MHYQEGCVLKCSRICAFCHTGILLISVQYQCQENSIIDGERGGGEEEHISIYSCSDHQNNRFRKKVILQNTPVIEFAPSLSSSAGPRQ